MQSDPVGWPFGGRLYHGNPTGSVSWDMRGEARSSEDPAPRKRMSYAGSNRLLDPPARVRKERLRQLGMCGARHGFTLLRMLAAERGRRFPELAALQLRLAFQGLGPAFVKMGQFVSSSPGTFPRALVEEFAHCQDAVPPEPWEQVAFTLEEDLGDLSRRFRWIEWRPMASGSIAQVYGAELPLGEQVVIKVQRTDLELTLRQDLRMMLAGARLLVKIRPSADVDTAELAALADRLDGVLEATPLRSGTSRYGVASEGPSVVYLMNETHPIGGLGNPVATPFTPSFDGELIGGTLRFPLTYEGTPGVVHGGFVAATLDHLLGGAAIRAGHLIVTGTLTVRYLRPTSTNTDLTIECWPGEIVGRKVRTHGRLLHGDDTIVEAEALFLTVDVERYTPPDPLDR